MRYSFYYLTRFLLHLPLRIFIRKLHLDGEENFPKDKPILLACNHPNSFLDGVIFEYFYRWRGIYTLARGDAFKKPLPNLILRSMRILPIFRARDARADVAREGNAQTNDEIYSIFKRNRVVLIFPEGSSYPEKRLRNLKRGTGNIAVEMAQRDDFALDLYVVPASINYSKFGVMRRTVHVTFGEPIKMQDYKKAILENERQAKQDVTERVRAELERIVVITEEEHKDEKEVLHEMMLNYNYTAVPFRIRNPWKLSIAKLNSAEGELLDNVSNYQKQLRSHGLRDFHVGGNSTNFLHHFLSFATLGLSLPVYFGWWLIWKMVLRVISKRVKNPIFTDSVILGVTIIISFMYLLLVVALVFVLFSGFWPILLAFVAIFGAISWFRTMEWIQGIPYQFNWWNLSEDHKKEIIAQREAIISKLK